MHKLIIFGGTTEGRILCEFCTVHNISVLYCIATVDGARSVEAMPTVAARVGRLNANEMSALLIQNMPMLVIDATHPYAGEARKNIRNACEGTGIRLVRVVRARESERDCIYFNTFENIIYWLEQEQGKVFVTTGVSSAAIFTKLLDFQNRVWLRILPNIDSLRTCLEMGYHPERIICMQGPFSEELNRAMFRSANARILITKDSGAAGGFLEKVKAAQSLGMIIAVLSKPDESNGVTLADACRVLMELKG